MRGIRRIKELAEGTSRLFIKRAGGRAPAKPAPSQGEDTRKEERTP